MAELLGPGKKVAIAYDTRNNSRYFAEAAKVLAAAGITALLFDRYSPVPLLSFAVRELKCDGGIVITASHNLRHITDSRYTMKRDASLQQSCSQDRGKRGEFPR